MKRLVVVWIVVVGSAAIIAALLVFRTPRTPSRAVLPIPNGYDDFAAAASSLVAWNGDLLAMPAEGIRTVVKQNSKVLEGIQQGLKKESAVPLLHDPSWLNQHMVQLTAHKQMAQLLVGEGMVHLNEGRTNEAARCFANGILFAGAAHRHGLIIDDLVAIACQAISARQLVPVTSHVSPDMLREILPALIALDEAREPAAAIVQRERDWSRETYGFLRMIWIKKFAHRNLRAAEMSFEKKHVRSVAALRLVITELAIRGYETKNGKLPAALAELVPAWLPAVPVDPFANKPLRYRITTNSFVLYSVGPDGKDDQGTPLKRGEMDNGDLLPTAF